MRPCKKGETHNPYGRPPTAKCIPDILRKIGEQPAPNVLANFIKEQFPFLEGELNNRQVMLYQVYLDAEKGDKDAREFIAERTEGKIPTTMSLNFDPEKVNLELNMAGINYAANEPKPNGAAYVDDQHTGG